MKSPLIVDERDFKWNLFAKILKIFGSRRVKQEIAKQGLKPVLLIFPKKNINLQRVLDRITYPLSEFKKGIVVSPDYNTNQKIQKLRAS